MPQRFLRPGITTSKRFNRCDWISQSLYIRLLTLVDDYGRYEADPELIRSQAFPFGMPNGTDMRLQTIVSSLQTLVSKGMLQIYTVMEKEFMQLTRWQENARSKSRFPDLKDGVLQTNVSDLQTNVNKCLSPSSSSSPQSSSSSSPSGNGAVAPVRGRFEKPTLQEVQLQCAKIGLPETEAQTFIDYYESNGWRVGKNPMSSWRGALGGWHHRWQERALLAPSKRTKEEQDKEILRQALE